MAPPVPVSNHCMDTRATPAKGVAHHPIQSLAASHSNSPETTVPGVNAGPSRSKEQLAAQYATLRQDVERVNKSRAEGEALRRQGDKKVKEADKELARLNSKSREYIPGFLSREAADKKTIEELQQERDELLKNNKVLQESVCQLRERLSNSWKFSPLLTSQTGVIPEYDTEAVAAAFKTLVNIAKSTLDPSGELVPQLSPPDEWKAEQLNLLCRAVTGPNTVAEDHDIATQVLQYPENAVLRSYIFAFLQQSVLKSKPLLLESENTRLIKLYRTVLFEHHHESMEDGALLRNFDAGVYRRWLDSAGFHDGRLPDLVRSKTKRLSMAIVPFFDLSERKDKIKCFERKAKRTGAYQRLEAIVEDALKFLKKRLLNADWFGLKHFSSGSDFDEEFMEVEDAYGALLPNPEVPAKVKMCMSPALTWVVESKRFGEGKTLRTSLLCKNGFTDGEEHPPSAVRPSVLVKAAVILEELEKEETAGAGSRLESEQESTMMADAGPVHRQEANKTKGRPQKEKPASGAGEEMIMDTGHEVAVEGIRRVAEGNGVNKGLLEDIEEATTTQSEPKQIIKIKTKSLKRKRGGEEYDPEWKPKTKD